MARARELGADQALSFLREIDEINMRRRQRTLEIGREMVGGSFLGRRVAVLGAAFKPDSDDVRDSPALSVAAAIQLHGAQVVVHDPEATVNARAQCPTLTYTTEVIKALDGADLVLHLTEWKQYRGTRSGLADLGGEHGGPRRRPQRAGPRTLAHGGLVRARARAAGAGLITG